MVGCHCLVIIGSFKWKSGVTCLVELVEDKNSTELLYVLFKRTKVVMLEVVPEYYCADEGDG